VYLAQEYAVGDSLDVVLRERATMPIADVVALVESLGAAIDHAARRGVSHGMLHPRDIIVAPDAARITGFGIAAALSKVGAKLPTRALNAASDIHALDAIVAGLKASTTNEAAVAPTFRSAAPVAPLAPLAPNAPIEDFDLRIEPPVDLMADADDDLADRLVVDAPPLPPPVFPAAWSAQPPRALQASDDVKPDAASRRWPIVAMFLVFAVLTALSVGFFLKSPTPAPVTEKEPGVDETIVDLSASAPAPVAPVAPNAPGAPAPVAPSAPIAPIAPSPSRPASGAVRRAQTGSVLVRSTPADADVLVDGKPRGKTPLALRDLALGSYTIRVARDGYAAEERTLQLTARRPTASTTINLRSDKSDLGGLNVQSRPSGARVFVNGRLAGSTPIAIPGLPAGPATVRIEKVGYVPWTATVRVSAGEQTPVRASLEGK